MNNIVINASTISSRKKRNSSGDTAAVHPYVVRAKQFAEMIGDKTPWTTSIITRTKESVSVKIITK